MKLITVTQMYSCWNIRHANKFQWRKMKKTTTTTNYNQYFTCPCLSHRQQNARWQDNKPHTHKHTRRQQCISFTYCWNVDFFRSIEEKTPKKNLNSIKKKNHSLCVFIKSLVSTWVQQTRNNNNKTYELVHTDRLSDMTYASNVNVNAMYIACDTQSHTLNERIPKK